MMRTRTWRAAGAAASATAALLLIGCQAAAPEEPPEPEVLSATKAGGLYLSAVCPVNEAWDELDVEVDRLRIAQSRGDDGTEGFSEAMLAVGEASERAAGQLEPKDRAWPADAVDEVEAVRDTLRDDAKQAEKVADLPIEKATVYSWKGAADAGVAAAEAREALGLPADAETACTQWQEAERSAAERSATEDSQTEKPATEKLATEKPATEKPVTEKSPAEKSGAAKN